MKILPLLLIAASLAGCATQSHTVSQEDKDFFWKGWWNPEQGSRDRMGYGDEPKKKGYDPEIPGGLL